MKKVLLFLLSLILLYPAVMNAQLPVKKVALKVLYVGGTSDFYASGVRNIPTDVLNTSVAKRMNAFEKFLNDYFTSVTVIKAENYTQELSDNYDVTIMDGRPRAMIPSYQDRVKNIYLTEGYLSNDFNRPMLTIADMSDQIGRRTGTKHDWY